MRTCVIIHAQDSVALADLVSKALVAKGLAVLNPDEADITQIYDYSLICIMTEGAQICAFDQADEKFFSRIFFNRSATRMNLTVLAVNNFPYFDASTPTFRIAIPDAGYNTKIIDTMIQNIIESPS